MNHKVLIFYFHLCCKTLFLPSDPPGYGQLPCSVTVMWCGHVCVCVSEDVWAELCGSHTLGRRSRLLEIARVCNMCFNFPWPGTRTHACTHQPTFEAMFFQARNVTASLVVTKRQVVNEVWEEVEVNKCRITMRSIQRENTPRSMT